MEPQNVEESQPAQFKIALDFLLLSSLPTNRPIS